MKCICNTILCLLKFVWLQRKYRLKLCAYLVLKKYDILALRKWPYLLPAVECVLRYFALWDEGLCCLIQVPFRPSLHNWKTKQMLVCGWVLVGVSGLINTLFYLSHRIIQVNESDEKQAIYFLKVWYLPYLTEVIFKQSCGKILF